MPFNIGLNFITDHLFSNFIVFL